MSFETPNSAERTPRDRFLVALDEELRELVQKKRLSEEDAQGKRRKRGAY